MKIYLNIFLRHTHFILFQIDQKIINSNHEQNFIRFQIHQKIVNKTMDTVYFNTKRKIISLLTKKHFLNLFKANQIWIVIILIFRLICTPNKIPFIAQIYY